MVRSSAGDTGESPLPMPAGAFLLPAERGIYPTPLLTMPTSCCDDDTTVYRIAKDILAGKADWLEEGIIKVLPT